MIDKQRTRASRAAIERLYITMRHLFLRGNYKPMGVSGRSLIESLKDLNPEIYGAMTDVERLELDGLLYVLERLPHGIEECRIIKLIAREGFEASDYPVYVPAKRRRNCYRIDEDRMYVEMTRGRSDIYDILTHLTFLYIEADKIKAHSISEKKVLTEDWKCLEEMIELEAKGKTIDEHRATVYLSNILGRTLEETRDAVAKFRNSNVRNSLYHIIYHLGNVAIKEEREDKNKEISFSRKLRDIVGHHTYGEKWANQIKMHLFDNGLIDRPIHIISANLHSVLNSLYGYMALPTNEAFRSTDALAEATSKPENDDLRQQIFDFAVEHGLAELKDTSGTNLTVQVIDTSQIDPEKLPTDLNISSFAEPDSIIIVMDYAFGEQAYECMEELLKPFENGAAYPLNIRSISIMGKAGVLEGNKGDLMIPTAHVFEGTADNYPIDNLLSKSDFEGDVPAYEGTMITVLGTSLQNRIVLTHFKDSTWNAVGLEMEGAHYQKAIQSAAKIRKSIQDDVKVCYAYYASDNPLKTGSTLASGSLGAEGVRPTYVITRRILEKILG